MPKMKPLAEQDPKGPTLTAMVGAELRRLRKESGYTLANVATLCSDQGYAGLKTAGCISERESGVEDLTLAQVQVLAVLYHSSPSAVVTVGWLAYKAAQQAAE